MDNGNIAESEPLFMTVSQAKVDIPRPWIKQSHQSFLITGPTLYPLQKLCSWSLTGPVVQRLHGLVA